MRFKPGSSLFFGRLLLATVFVLSGVVAVKAQCNPRQIFKLLADDNERLDIFGNSVEIQGTTAIVGAPWDDDNGDSSGSAYLFDITTGEQIAKLLPNEGATNDRFGWWAAAINHHRQSRWYEEDP